MEAQADYIEFMKGDLLEYITRNWKMCRPPAPAGGERRQEMGEWIPVGERVPEDEYRVLCSTRTKKGANNVIIGYYSAELGRWVGGMMSEVVAWMPLPEPYEE